MSYTASKLIAIAEAEVGYLEKETNSTLDSKTGNAGDENFTKYARDLHAAGYYQANKNGYEWCEVFNDWCHWIASGKDAKLAQEIICQTGLYGAGCVWSAKCYRDAGRFYTTPQVGDQIYFGKKGEEHHTGIVYKVDKDTVYTIEGNTSGASGVIANGGGVCKKSYPLGYAKIVGYGRPRYDAEETAVKEETKPADKKEGVCKVELRVLKNGMSGADVKAMQMLLLGHGFKMVNNKKTYGADGSFGGATGNALEAFQRAKGLEPDRVCGPLTWGKLLGTT